MAANRPQLDPATLRTIALDVDRLERQLYRRRVSASALPVKRGDVYFEIEGDLIKFARRLRLRATRAEKRRAR